MKKHMIEFLKRGVAFCWGGPVVLAIIYGILGACGVIQTMTPGEVTRGILTVTLMAFIAAGVTVVYQIEQLPLVSALLIHGAALYLDYLIIYLANGWLSSSAKPLLIFTGIFAAGYALIWLCIYFSVKARTDRINRTLDTQM